MVFAIFIGLGLGVTGGLLLGGQLFKGHGSISSEKYRHLDQIADTEEDVDPNIPKATGEYRDILKYAPKWTTWPDFEQVRWVNSTIEWLWPYLAQGIKKMATQMAKPILEDLVANSPLLDEIVVQELDLGPLPLRLAGIKVYDTKDDEVILEAPVQWGSAVKVHVMARVRLGPASIYIPVKVEDLQMSANARITIRPLVDTLPCLGAISISLTESPFVDLSLKAINNMDLLSVPFVHEAVLMAVKMVTEQIVVYPNQIPVPLMENSGLPKPPSGMLELTVQRCSNLRSKDLVGKGDPYVKVSVLTMGTTTDKHGKEHPMIAHEDPPHTTAVKSGKDPVFNERFKILIPELQSDKHVLAFRVMDRDKLGQDDTVAEYDIRLNKKSHEKNNEFLRTGEEVPMTLLLKPKSGSMESKAGQPAGELYVLMQYTPFFNANTEVDEDDPGKVMEKVKKQQQASVITDSTMGVLFVEVPRCTDLPLLGPTCDSYVELRLSDPDNPNGPEISKSEVVYNERSPRYRCKKEFVYISANSTLTLTVFDVPGLFEMSNIIKLGQKSDSALGKVRIHVKDVARAGRLKDSFPLQDADQGDMHVLLSWTTVERDD